MLKHFFKRSSSMNSMILLCTEHMIKITNISLSVYPIFYIWSFKMLCRLPILKYCNCAYLLSVFCMFICFRLSDCLSVPFLICQSLRSYWQFVLIFYISWNLICTVGFLDFSAFMQLIRIKCNLGFFLSFFKYFSQFIHAFNLST